MVFPRMALMTLSAKRRVVCNRECRDLHEGAKRSVVLKPRIARIFTDWTKTMTKYLYAKKPNAQSAVKNETTNDVNFSNVQGKV